MYLGWLTKQHTSRSICVFLTDQHTWQSIPAEWLTNIYPGWLTNQHTGLSVSFDWPTNIPAYHCQHTSLSRQADWLPNIPDIIISIRETYQPIHQGWLTNIPDYLSGMTDQPTYLTIRVDWLTSVPAFLSGLTDSQTYPTIYPYWNLCIVSVLSAAYQSMLIAHFHIRTDSLLPLYSAYLSGPTDYLSGPTDWPTSCYLRIYIFGLTAFQSDWPSCLCSYPAYLSGLTSDLHICLSVWADSETFLPSFLALHIKAD